MYQFFVQLNMRHTEFIMYRIRDILQSLENTLPKIILAFYRMPRYCIKFLGNVYNFVEMYCIFGNFKPALVHLSPSVAVQALNSSWEIDL